MAIKKQSYTSPDKAEIDRQEQKLKGKGFTQVSPLVKMQPRQYSRSQAQADHKSFDGPLNYMIEWCVDE
jgi:hypothetical protein